MSNIFNLFPDTEYNDYIVPSYPKWNLGDTLNFDDVTISTNYTSPKLTEGEIWFVKLPQNTSLQKMRVVKLHEKVVELKTEVSPTTTAYKISEVDFVEKVND